MRLRFFCLFPAVLLLACSTVFSQPETNPQPFSQWLEELRLEAIDSGMSAQTVNSVLATVTEPIPSVIENDRNQPEFVQTFSGYMQNRISDARIQRGQALMEEHKDLFDRIYAEYGIPAHYLVSFWALESNFGDYTGGFSVVNALATLAYDPRRSDMFRRELLTALRIIDQGHISAERMTGSWAGAMGQCQFMPSTFDTYARDGDGDGRIDIWNSIPDIFASAANFLASSGWKRDERWGREILLPEGFDYALSGTSTRKTVTEWNQLGVMRANGEPLGNASLEGSIILPAGADGPAFLGYNNFRTTMVWNRSTFYAISVGHLADRFSGEGPILHMGETERALSRNEVIEMQTILNDLGMDAGEPDGIMGSQTRGAIRRYQEFKGSTPDGYASATLLEELQQLEI